MRTQFFLNKQINQLFHIQKYLIQAQYVQIKQKLETFSKIPPNMQIILYLIIQLYINLVAAPKVEQAPAPQQVNWQKVYFKYYNEENDPYYFHPLLAASSYEKPGPGCLILDIDGSQEFIDNTPKPVKNEPVVINDLKEVYGKKHGPPGANLFIFHLPNDYRDSDLEKLFSEFGEVISARVNTRPDGTSKGFGFISFTQPSQAEAAIAGLNGLQLKNKRLKVEIKKEGQEMPSNSKSSGGSLHQTSFHPF